MHHPTDRITHTTAFVTPVMEHWLDREISHRRERDVAQRYSIRSWYWVVGSILHGVDPLSYFSLQPVLHDWCNKDPLIIGRKEMFYLTMYSTHFILRLYGVKHMVKDHSYIHTLIHKLHTYIHTQTRIHTYTYIHTYIETIYIYMCVCVYI